MATGVFGGTFDPVHIGHLRTALEIKRFLKLDRMLMIPCADPPHREAPMTPAKQRLEMVRLAVKDEPGLMADDREIKRPGISYSIDTVISLRDELGGDEPICFCIGMDSLNHLASWYRWQDFLTFCHVVVAARPGFDVPQGSVLMQWIEQFRTRNHHGLLEKPAGHLYIDEMTLLPVSATGLREKLKKRESIRYLTPDSVIDYIARYQLYVQ